ncbi:hypothetical protein TWF506_008771 [Arthrobotrys conoides]|uniref:Uncharacterized protein n=1 Tax=Arthrobotrys conoides TaxID=74498 RepID=A0AAN8NNI1_9PEZI
MCFFNRLRFKCGHSQTCIFQTCAIARHTRGRTYHTTCRPSKRSHRNVKSWDLLGSCENCLRLQYGGNSRGYMGNTPGIGIPSDRYGMYGYGYGYEGYGGGGEGYYPYYPAGDRVYNTYGGGGGYTPRYWDRDRYNHHHNPFYDHHNLYPHRRQTISSINPDECDDANCMNINTPKDIQRSFLRSGLGTPYLGSGRGMVGGDGYGYGGYGYNGGRGRYLENMGMGMGYQYGIDDGRYMYQDDVDGMGMRGLSPELETTPLRAIEGGDGYDGYEGVGGRSPFMGRRRNHVPDAHMVD